MNIKEAVYLAAAILSLESAVYVFYLNRRSMTNVIYSLLAADFAAISFILYMITEAPSHTSCLWWYGANTIPGCLVPPLSLHLSLCIARKKSSAHPVLLSLIYIPALAFMALMSYGGFFRSYCAMTGWGWETIIKIDNRYAFVFILYANLSLLVSSAIIILWRFRAVNEIEKIQSKSIFFPYLAGIAGMFLCPYFLHIERNELLNMLIDISGHILFVSFLVGIRFSIRNSSFLKISADSPVSEIIRGLRDPVMLIDTDGAIIQFNASAGRLMETPEVPAGRSIFGIFDRPDALKTAIGEIFAGGETHGEIHSHISSDKKDRKSFSLRIQPIVNAEIDNSSGALVFIREDLSINRFREKYGITDRQFDIIVMVVAGLTNREIAEKSGITEKTVENHLFNIYNRLGIDSKIELFNLARKHGIIPN
jgi:DNA-binding CsgD family transcriptional regulator